jgi:hypothetical protein
VRVLKYTNTQLKMSRTVNSWWSMTRTHHKVTKLNEMASIFYLLCEDVSKIMFTINMLNGNKVSKNIFPNSVLPHLYMTKTFSSARLSPIYTSLIVIIYDIDRRHKQILNSQKVKYLNLLQQEFNTLISGVNFSFSRATCGDRLTFRNPV